MADDQKIYSRREDAVSTVIHFAGSAIFLFSAILLIPLAEKYRSAVFNAGVIFYWLSLIVMFSASAVYHLITDPEIKAAARKFDHCAIYLLITGTYAPLITGAVKTAGGYIILALLILMTAAGIAAKIIFNNKYHFIEVCLYLLMGWACVFIAGDLIEHMTAKALYLLLAGGITYSAGVIFYVSKKEFSHAVWHLFVLAGAILQFFAIVNL